MTTSAPSRHGTFFHLVLGLVAALFGCHRAHVAAPSPLAGSPPSPTAWVELGPSGEVIARVITPGAACPELVVDSTAIPMQERAAPAPPAYPVRVCEASLPPGARAASIAGQALPLPKPDPARIVVIGDTGCRIKGNMAQACNDPRQWPFRQLAASAASWGPDLVIHVGDYIYREAPCPAGNDGCAGSPYGSSWATWQADFFEPAAALLRAAPWVFVRGNHEDCKRAGEGWFRFLDPRARPASCEDYTEPYVVPAGGLQLQVMDSSAARDDKTPDGQLEQYRRQFEALRSLASNNAWHIMHHPLWGAWGIDHRSVFQEAFGGALAPGVRLVLAGHEHLFEYLSFQEPHPSSLVVGNSGTQLDVEPSSPVGKQIDGREVEAAALLSRFGFVTATSSPESWKVELRDEAGEQMLTCTLSGSRLECAPR